MNVQDFMRQAEPHGTICNAIAKTWDVLGRYRVPVVSVSGGADSDIVLDIIHKLDEERKSVYVWYNTGLEFEATKRHLDYLEQRYGIQIQRVPANKPIAQTVKEFGYPFLAKFVADRIESLQFRGFDFVDRTFEQDMQLFPNCWSNLKWWHNIGSLDLLNISRYKLLREFLIKYPPKFRISGKCCSYTKKKPSRDFLKKHNADLSILGLRKCEGGIRAATKNCLTQNRDDDYAVFRPIFWFRNKDKAAYEEKFGITHSDCYIVYGLRRTGCVGCPFNYRLLTELDIVRKFEPGLVRAAEAVFGPVYEYLRKYREYRALHSGETLPLFDSEEDVK